MPCSELLSYRRGDLSRERVYPPEKEVSEEEIRIGVVVCLCGANIGRVVDTHAVVDYAAGLPNVVYAARNMFACSTENAQLIADAIVEHNLNRVVLAACTHGPTSRCSGTPVVKLDSTNTILNSQISGSTVPGFTPGTRKAPPTRPRTSSGCPWREPPT